MKAFKGGAFFLVISIMFIAGCGTIQDTLGWNESNNFERPPSEDAPWPDYIPAEIPELPGEIRTIMVAPKSHIRMFYINIPVEQIEEYLALLVDQGFKLEYRIHVQEGFPDNSEERRQRGEYDDIDITKGEYHMTLWHWEGTATYDVYTSGFQEIVEEAIDTFFLGRLVPKPERCELGDIIPSFPDTAHVSCNPQDKNVLLDYIQVLESLGFEETSKYQTPSGDIMMIRLNDGTTTVDLSADSPEVISIRIEQINR